MTAQQELQPVLQRKFASGMVMNIYDQETAERFRQLEQSVPPHELGFPEPISPNTKDTVIFQK